MMHSSPYFLIGAGGHAKVIARAIQEGGGIVEGIFDDDPAKQGTQLAGVRIVGKCADIIDHPRRPTVIAVGNNRIRKQISEQFDLDWGTVIHPSAVIDSTAKLGHGSVVMAGAVIQADVQMGDHGIINTGATVDHDCQLGAFFHVAPGTHIAGHCEIGEGAFLGIGVSMIPSRRVGDWTTVGAGAAVVCDLPAGVVATGVPAKIR